jgi:DNA-binding IclR family transcriptional regulator
MSADSTIPMPATGAFLAKTQPIRHSGLVNSVQARTLPTLQPKSGKSVGAVVAAVRVLQRLHESPHPLNAGQIARDLSMYRGTVSNILRTLEAEGLVACDSATRTYSIGIRVLEFAHGLLRSSGVMDLVRPILFALAEKHKVSAYVTRVMDDTLVLLDMVGTGFRIDFYMSVGRRYPSVAGAPGAIMGAFSGLDAKKIRTSFQAAEWFRKPSWKEFQARIKSARDDGYAVDRGDRWQGLCQISAPVLDRNGQFRFLLTIVGLTHDLDAKRVQTVARDAVVSASRISDGLALLRIN